MTSVIVLPIHNALDYVKRSLTQILGTTPSSVPLVIVDDCSDVETSTYLTRTIECYNTERRIVRLTNKRQQLFTRSVNRGLRYAVDQWSPEIVIAVNSDVDLRPGWSVPLVAAMDVVPKLAIVGYHDSPPHGFKEHRYTTIRFPDYITGHCIALRTQALREIGVFCETDTDGRADPSLASYKGQAHIGSERIWCWKAMTAGWEASYCNSPLCFHEAGKSWHHDLYWLSRFDLQPLWTACDTLDAPKWLT